jgi:hypothetical protein
MMVAPPPVDCATFKVTWSRSPFSADGITINAPVGTTLAGLVDLFDCLPHARFMEVGTVYLGGSAIDRTFWRLVRPKSGAEVVLRLVPGGGGRGGGGGAKNILSTVASLAVVLSAAAISGGALGPAGLGLFGASFAAGGTGASITGAGVALAGALALSALAPPPSSSRRRENEGGQSGASANVAAPGSQLPRVVGKMRFAPPAVTQPLVELRGEDEFVEVVYALAGPHSIEDIRVGDVDEGRIEDFDVQTREGWDDDTALTLVTRYAHTESPNVELSEFRTDDDAPQELLDQTTPADASPEWHAFTSRMNCDEIWINFMFPEGIYDASGASSADKFMALPLRIRIRLRGALTWINLPELHIVNRRSGLVRRCVKIVWASTPTVTAPPDDRGFRQAFQRVGSLSGPDDWEADAHFYSGSGNRWMDSTNFGSTGVQNLILKRHEAIIYLQSGSQPKGIYDIEIKKGSIARVTGGGTAVGDPSDYVSDGYTGTAAPTLFDYWTDTGTDKAPISQDGLYQATVVSRISSVENSPPVNGTGCALIAIKAKNRNVQPVTALFGGYVPDYESGPGTWTDWKTTKNPAPHFRYVLRDDLIARKLPTARLDDASLIAWRSRCNSDGLQVSAIIDGASVNAALDLIAAAGYARRYSSETWGVIQDKDRSGDAPVQLLSHRNSRGLSIGKAFPQRPHAFIARFKNEDVDYRDDFVTIYDTGYNADGSGGNTAACIFEEITYDGLTKNSLVQSRAAFDLEQSRRRSKTYRLTMSAEAMACRRGDLVAIQSDIFHGYAGQARVVSKTVNGGGKVTRIVLDDQVPRPEDMFFGSDDFTFGDGASGADEPFFGDDPDDPFFGAADELKVTIRLDDGDGTTIECEATIDEDTPYRLDIVSPYFDDDADLVAGCLVVTGTQLARRCIVAAAVPGEDLTFDLELVDEAPQLWS